MSAHSYKIAPEEWNSFRRKLTSKVRFQLGHFCSDIEDLVQETLARFHRALDDDTLQRPESMGAFLNAICNNVISEYRRRLWREVPYDSEAPPDHPAAPTVDLLEIRNSTDFALEKLNVRDRAVLTAFYLHEQEKTEICRSMGVTDAQFRVIIFRAKKRMRELLHDRTEISVRRY